MTYFDDISDRPAQRAPPPVMFADLVTGMAPRHSSLAGPDPAAAPAYDPTGFTHHLQEPRCRVPWNDAAHQATTAAVCQTRPTWLSCGLVVLRPMSIGPHRTPTMHAQSPHQDQLGNSASSTMHRMQHGFRVGDPAGLGRQTLIKQGEPDKHSEFSCGIAAWFWMHRTPGKSKDVVDNSVAPGCP